MILFLFYEKWVQREKYPHASFIFERSLKWNWHSDQRVARKQSINPLFSFVLITYAPLQPSTDVPSTPTRFLKVDQRECLAMFLRHEIQALVLKWERSGNLPFREIVSISLLITLLNHMSSFICSLYLRNKSPRTRVCYSKIRAEHRQVPSSLSIITPLREGLQASSI